LKNLLAALLLSISLPAAAADMAKMNAVIDSANFLVNDSCSGTLVDAERGYVLTAHHCIDQQYRTVTREKVSDDGKVTEEKIREARPGTVSQKFFKNSKETQTNSYAYKIVASDRNLDLALLRVEAKVPGPAAVMGCVAPGRGDTVFAVGNPYGILFSSIAKGIVSSINRSYEQLGIFDQSDERLVQISPGIVGGNSGGAVYNEAVEFVGVPVRGSRMNEVIGFSVPLADVRTFLERQGAKDLFKRCE
jgi:S1-C subfamily serine protease